MGGLSHPGELVPKNHNQAMNDDIGRPSQETIDLYNKSIKSDKAKERLERKSTKKKKGKDKEQNEEMDMMDLLK